MQWWLRWGYFLSLSSILIGAGPGWAIVHTELHSVAQIDVETMGRGDAGIRDENSPCPHVSLSPCQFFHSDEKPNPSRLVARQTCPTDIQALTIQLLQDLPGYANRIYRQYGIPGYVLIAGRPEFQPLSLGPDQRTTVPENSVNRDDPQQVFITTLERHYQGDKAVELQQYHWIFLTQTNSGWRFAMMYSMVGPYPAGYPPSPPQESSDGSIAGAVQTWLRDCRSKSPGG